MAASKASWPSDRTQRPAGRAQQTFAVAEKEEKPDEIEELKKEFAALKAKVDNPTMPVVKVADVCGLCHGQHPPTACPFMNGQVGPGESEWVEPGSAGEEVFYVEG